jgi:cell division protein FtsB
MNPVVKSALQGAIPTLVLVGGTNLIVKKFRETRPVLYWGSLAVATGVAVAVVQGRIPAPFMNAESLVGQNCKFDDTGYCYTHDRHDCDFGTNFWDAESFEARENKDGTIVLTDNEWNSCIHLYNGNYLWGNKELKLIDDGLKNSAKFKKETIHGYEALRMIHLYERLLRKRKVLNAETFSADSNIDYRSANLRELRKLLERELSRLAQDNHKIEYQLKKLEKGTPKEYPIEIIRDLLSNMHESLGAINGYGMNYLTQLQ